MSTEFEFALLDFLRYCYGLEQTNLLIDHMRFYTSSDPSYDAEWGGNIASDGLKRIFNVN